MDSPGAIGPEVRESDYPIARDHDYRYMRCARMRWGDGKNDSLVRLRLCQRYRQTMSKLTIVEPSSQECDEIKELFRFFYVSNRTSIGKVGIHRSFLEGFLLKPFSYDV